MQPQFTRVEEPTLLCNQVVLIDFHLSGNRVYQDLGYGNSMPPPSKVGVKKIFSPWGSALDTRMVSSYDSREWA